MITILYLINKKSRVYFYNVFYHVVFMGVLNLAAKMK